MKKMLPIIIIIIGLIAILFVGSDNNNNTATSGFDSADDNSSTSDANDAPAAQNLGNTPKLTLKDYNDNKVNISTLGKPAIINAWTSWCPFCIKELPDFAAIQEEFNGELVVLAINRAESLGTAKTYTDDLNITYDLIFLLDPSDNFYSSIGGFSMPETLFVDAEGIIRDHKRGPMDIDEMRTRINNALNL